MGALFHSNRSQFPAHRGNRDRRQHYPFDAAPAARHSLIRAILFLRRRAPGGWGRAHTGAGADGASSGATIARIGRDHILFELRLATLPHNEDALTDRLARSLVAGLEKSGLSIRKLGRADDDRPAEARHRPGARIGLSVPESRKLFAVMPER